jgi:hypothetical protein
VIDPPWQPLGSTGKIQIFGSSGGAVASIDMAASTVTDTIGGTSFVLLRPVYVDGNAVVLYPKTKALGYGQTYYVTVDAGAIKLRTVGRTGVIVQSRNGVGAYGYVFVDCKLTADSAAKNNMLARIDVSTYPGSHVAYINCQMTNIGSAGAGSRGDRNGRAVAVVRSDLASDGRRSP